MTSRPTPPRYKLALLTWAGAYAVITLLLAVLGPPTATWPLPLRTLVLSALMAPAMTWLVMPLLTRVFRSWLASSPRRPRECDRERPAVAASPPCSGGSRTRGSGAERADAPSIHRASPLVPVQQGVEG
jgi:hypothetical protein